MAQIEVINLVAEAWRKMWEGVRGEASGMWEVKPEVLERNELPAIMWAR